MFSSQYLYFLKHNLSARLFGKRQPLLAGFKITYRCSLKCRSCPFWKKTPSRLSYREAVQVLDSFYAAGVRLLIFEGGEPFLWADQNYRLEDLVAYAKQKFFRVGITTNGLLPLESAADMIWVSIDGLKATHEQNRGKCFDRILTNIDNSRHPNLLANITISRLNYAELPELVKFLSSRVKGITIQFYYPFPDSEDLSLSAADRFWVLDKLMELKKDGYPILDSKLALSRLKKNNWKCFDWLIANANPDGKMTLGCYLKDRAEISCEKCGFAAHTEISLAYDWKLGAILAGHKIFSFKFI